VSSMPATTSVSSASPRSAASWTSTDESAHCAPSAWML
jgi:hypothetical protein